MKAGGGGRNRGLAAIATRVGLEVEAGLTLELVRVQRS